MLNHQQIKEIVRRQALLVRFNPELVLEACKVLPTAADRDQVIQFVRDLVRNMDGVRPDAMAVLERVHDALKQQPVAPPPPRPSAPDAHLAEARRAS
jgi:hypothetical protein